MSSIVIVEPYKMLQHAFVLALPVEHKYRVVERPPEATALEGVDAVIVDAAALLEKGKLSARELDAIESWRTPTLWIEAGGKPVPPVREGLVMLQKPVRGDELQKALAECLGLAALDKPRTGSAKLKQVKKARAPRGSAKAGDEPGIIELVDVVEETAAEQNSTPEN
jgi:hypothetical protein